MRVLIFFLLVSFHSFSQDAIRSINNEVKAVKISEIDVEKIKYHDFIMKEDKCIQ